MTEEPQSEPDVFDAHVERSGKEWALLIIKRVLFLLGPIFLGALLFLFFWFVFPPAEGSMVSPEFIVFAGLMIAYLVPPFGKETIIPAALIGGEAVIGLISAVTSIPAGTAVSGYPLWTVVVGIVVLDLLVALFISLNFDLLLKIPIVGQWFRWIMRGADNVLKKKKWVENLSSAGLLIFMYIPLQGSGAMTTSIIARILNYRPLQTVGLVTFGSILSCLTVAFGIQSLIQLWEINPALAILEGVVIVGVILLIAFFWNKLIRKLTERAEKKKALQCESAEK
ncbi:MAG TPA: small multi-drug export protein [Methanocorpusculum sp.]|nr:small multi-drug export protein [Methanocorpusculum sp.]